jgi:hypothetical protein
MRGALKRNLAFFPPVRHSAMPASSTSIPIPVSTLDLPYISGLLTGYSLNISGNPRRNCLLDAVVINLVVHHLAADAAAPCSVEGNLLVQPFPIGKRTEAARIVIRTVYISRAQRWAHVSPSEATSDVG